MSRRPPSSRLYALFYIAALSVATLISASAMVWFFGAYLVEGLAPVWPPKTILTVPIALAAALAGGILSKSLPVPTRPGLRVLSRRGFWLGHRVLRAAGGISFLRFIVPLVWSGAPFFGAKPHLPEARIWFVATVCSAVARVLLPVFTKNLRETADELLARDQRKPVLYLRSFEMESQKGGVAGVVRKYQGHLKGGREGTYLTAGASFGLGGRQAERSALGVSRSGRDEQMVFATAFSSVGPYIAIGRPTEDFRTMDLGAAKKYVADDVWQDTVSDWLESSAAVVIEAADSNGLAWEIKQVAHNVAPERVLIMCPQTDDEYLSFMLRTAQWFPKPLPAARPKSRLLAFNASWQPVELENMHMDAAASLEPFFERLRLKDDSRPRNPNLMLVKRS